MRSMCLTFEIRIARRGFWRIFIDFNFTVLFQPIGLHFLKLGPTVENVWNEAGVGVLPDSSLTFNRTFEHNFSSKGPSRVSM